MTFPFTYTNFIPSQCDDGGDGMENGQPTVQWAAYGWLVCRNDSRFLDKLWYFLARKLLQFRVAYKHLMNIVFQGEVGSHWMAIDGDGEDIHKLSNKLRLAWLEFETIVSILLPLDVSWWYLPKWLTGHKRLRSRGVTPSSALVRMSAEARTGVASP